MKSLRKNQLVTKLLKLTDYTKEELENDWDEESLADELIMQLEFRTLYPCSPYNVEGLNKAQGNLYGGNFKEIL